MADLTRRTKGAHQYLGKYSSRGKRKLSKLHKGMPECGNLKAIFDRIELDRTKRKELVNGINA